jgi:hypothetical protein
MSKFLASLILSPRPKIVIIAVYSIKFATFKASFIFSIGTGLGKVFGTEI